MRRCDVGRRLVEFEQLGDARAEYGERVVVRLAELLTVRFGRGFSERNLQQMRLFFITYPQEWIYATLSRTPTQIPQTLSAESEHGNTRQAPNVTSYGDLSIDEPQGNISPPASVELVLGALATVFPLSWSHYVRLLSVKDEFARRFYEEEARRGGWSRRQLDRQIGTLCAWRANKHCAGGEVPDDAA